MSSQEAKAKTNIRSVMFGCTCAHVFTQAVIGLYKTKDS